MRLPISLQERPLGEPRRIRNTLYCVGEMSAAFKTGSSLLANWSAVTASAMKTCSSKTPLRRVLVADWMPLLTVLIIVVETSNVKSRRAIREGARGALH